MRMLQSAHLAGHRIIDGKHFEVLIVYVTD